jgi:hypothetical protein
MDRKWLPIIGMCVGGVAVGAQAPPSTLSRDVISAIGCVQLAGADGTTPTTSQGLGPALVLTGARIAPSLGLVEPSSQASQGAPASNEGSQATNSAEPGSGAPPSEARASGADIGSRRDTGLSLAADRGIELDQHVGHRVMVTGRLSSFAAPGGVASASSGQTLTVTKVSVIAPACTPGS